MARSKTTVRDDGRIHARGVDYAKYQRLRRIIRATKDLPPGQRITWTDFEAAGECLPSFYSDADLPHRLGPEAYDLYARMIAFKSKQAKQKTSPRPDANNQHEAVPQGSGRGDTETTSNGT